MKRKFMIICAGLLLQMNGFSRDLPSNDLPFEIHGAYSKAIAKEKMLTARKMGDIIPMYPSSWILEYISTDISVRKDGSERNAKGKNDVLSNEQIDLLNTADLGSEITITIEYKCKNGVTDKIELSTMHYRVSIVPKLQAQYAEGDAKLRKYFKESVVDKISETSSIKIQSAAVRFTVSENGEIINVKILRTSGNVNVDSLLLDAVKRMPKWVPAVDSDGLKVKQNFEFSIGNQGGC